MKIAYIILAHHLPEHLGGLIRRLDAPDAAFFVHIDRNSDDATARAMIAAAQGRPNVYFLPRHACAWGQWGIVAATLEGLRQVIRARVLPDYVVLLSGQDYPLKTPAEIAAFLAAHRGTAFINMRALPDYTWNRHGALDRFHDQPLPGGMTPYGGSQWWALTGDCAAYVVGVADTAADLVRLFEAAVCPDEHFFQTVIGNSPFRDRLAAGAAGSVLGVHYVDWERGMPKVLDTEDYDRLIASSALFARKFDVSHDAAILDMIDAHLDARAAGADEPATPPAPPAPAVSPPEPDAAHPAAPVVIPFIREASDARGGNEQAPALTIGMATYDDFEGVYFTIQALRLGQDLSDTELLVIDNYGCEHTRNFVENWAGARYVLAREAVGTAAPRDLVFREARGAAVLCCDSHVLFWPGAIARLKAYYRAHPETRDLIQGPIVYDDLRNISTHLDPVWREHFWGTWATDPRGEDVDGAPFEIPMHGLGVFSCRKEAWLGFNPRFRGFGGEEGYIHEKFRRAGHRCLCLPGLRWIHRFGRPRGVPYPLTVDDKLRNYLIGHAELGLDPVPVMRHFAGALPEERILAIALEALWEPSAPAPAAADAADALVPAP